MDFFPENYDVTITVPLLNGEGVSELPLSGTAIVTDAENQEIVDLGSLTIPGSGTSIDVDIDGANNSMASGELRRAQILIVTLTYPEGDVTSRHAYGIERDISLEIMNNSFMTFEAAEIEAFNFVSTIGWTVSTESQKKVALMNAFAKLTQIPMKWNPRDEDGCPIRSEENVIYRDTWAEIDADAYALFPTHFKRALRRAQFIEANELLQGNTFAAKRRQGLIREKIGESEVEINSNTVDYGVDSQTLSALAGYINFDMRIKRA